MVKKTLKLVCFSPTGTTRTVVESIAKGINCIKVEFIDITLPFAREKVLVTAKDELLIVAVPVYMGRVPSVLSDWFNTFKADNTPTVCVVVYGNRAYDDALLELKDLLINSGCKPIAAAAFIGEHHLISAIILQYRAIILTVVQNTYGISILLQSVPIVYNAAIALVVALWVQ